jgi:hypothetical protein
LASNQHWRCHPITKGTREAGRQCMSGS